MLELVVPKQDGLRGRQLGWLGVSCVAGRLVDLHSSHQDVTPASCSTDLEMAQAALAGWS